MNHLASILDYALYALVAMTLALILYKALALYKPTLIGQVSHAQLLGNTHDCLEVGLEELENWLSALAIIASTAPFIGLAGTVLHIMEALRSLSSGSADMALISGPISTALNSTLVGLGSAIPAAVAHACFQRRLQVLENGHRRLLARNAVSSEKDVVS